MIDPEVWRSAQDLPSVKRFLNTIVNDLVQGKNVIAFFPPGFDTDTIRSSISDLFWGRNLYSEQRDVSCGRTVPADARLLDNWLIGSEFPIDPGTSAESASNFRFPDVINLVGLDRLQDDDRTRWIRLVQEWAEICRTSISDNHVSYRFLLMLSTGTVPFQEIPKTDVLLDIRWWWGLPSALELRLLCRELDSGDGEIRTAWRECLVSGVAPGDLMLASALWSEFPRNYQELCEQLKSYGKGVIPTTGLPKGSSNIGRRYRVRNEDELPPSYYDDWQRGAIIGSYEYGVERHPAVLAINGARDQLEHRMWRGQSPFLMPLVDQVRHDICSKLVRRYGNDWFDKLDPPKDPQQLDRLKANPFDAEFGYLRVMSINYSNDFRQAGLDRSDINPAWVVRNDLSHYDPVEWDAFYEFYSQYNPED